MKTLQGLFIVALALGFLLVSACKYDAPLTTKHTIKIDSKLLGLWEAVPEVDADDDEAGENGDDTWAGAPEDADDQEEEEEPPTLLIMKFSDTEYVVVYSEDDESMYFRAYPIKIGETECVQLQAIGTSDDAVDEDESDLYMVMKYTINADGQLVVHALNDDLVDDGLQDSEALKAAFLEHEHDENLFGDEALVFTQLD